MTSTITACRFIENWIETKLDEVERELKPESWDCQDTECNNETECYFYYPQHIGEEKTREFASRLCKMLGVPDDCYDIEYNEDLKVWRVEIICTISVRLMGMTIPLVVGEED